MRHLVLVSTLAVAFAAASSQLSAQALLNASIGTQPFESLGSAVDAAGDVNADGYADYIVDAPNYTGPGGEFAGAALVYSGIDGSVLHIFYGDAPNDNFGYAVAGAGDVNGDGYDDVIASTPFNSANGNRSGLARVFSGQDGALLYEYKGPVASSELGWTVAGVGDVNRDGRSDFAISTKVLGADPQVRVYSGMDGTILLTLLGDGGPDGFGQSLDGAGDVDADGVPDIIVGMTGSQKARVFSGVDGHTLFTFDRPYAQSWFWAFAVAGAGDVNSDGHADLVVGAYGDDKVFNDGGMARVFSGADGSTLYTFYGWWPTIQLGYDVDGAGDVNGDGFDDILVGAPRASDGASLESGELAIYSGKDGTLLRAFAPPPIQPGDQLGHAVAGIGDANGDGFDDVVGGAPRDSAAIMLSGAVATFSLRHIVNEIDPPEVVYSKPTPISLLGNGFEPDSPISVKVNGTPATSVTWVSSQRVDCVTPGNGVQNTVVDVTLEQNGQTVLLPAGLKVAGTKIFGVWPPTGPVSGGDEVVIYGDHFVNDATTNVYFGGQLSQYKGTIEEIIEPNIIVVLTPAMPASGLTGVKVTSSAGTAFLNVYIFRNRWVYPHTGNIAGGEVITMYGDIQVSPTNDITARIGLVPAEVLSVEPGKAEILTPASEEATGNLQDVWLLSPTIGSQVVQGTYLYTPYANATKSGNVFNGLKLAVSVRSSTPNPQNNLVTLFTVDPTMLPPPGSPLGPQTSGSPGAGISGGASGGGTSASGASMAAARPPKHPLDGPLGKLYGAPVSILAANVPVPILATALKLNLGQVSPILIGTTVYVQGLVTGEGNPFGTYTNPMSYVIQ